MLREGTAPVVHRQDYQQPAFWIRRADLTFDLEPAKTIVASRLEIERNPARPGEPLRLHGEGLNLMRVLANGESVSFRHEDGQLVIDHPPADARFVLEVRNTCAPDKNTELSGLYTSGGSFFTQCEAEGFLREARRASCQPARWCRSWRCDTRAVPERQLCFGRYPQTLAALARIC